MKTKITYTIECYIKAKNIWFPMTTFQYMSKSFADGAWQMLKAFYGGELQYRFVNSNGKIIEVRSTGKIVVN